MYARRGDKREREDKHQRKIARRCHSPSKRSVGKIQYLREKRKKEKKKIHLSGVDRSPPFTCLQYNALLILIPIINYQLTFISHSSSSFPSFSVSIYLLPSLLPHSSIHTLAIHIRPLLVLHRDGSRRIDHFDEQFPSY